MTNWNKMIRALRTAADKYLIVKRNECAVMESPRHGINAVKQAAKEHETSLNDLTRHCKRYGVKVDDVMTVCADAYDFDSCVKNMLFNGAIIGPVIKACEGDETAENTSTPEEVA